jgi:hypothetical protein
MPTRILAARKFTKVLYDGPERTDIRLRVESSEPVDIYGVTAVFLDNFRKDRTADLFRFIGKTDLKKRIPLSPALGEEWYLIIENRSNSAVAIHYEVFDV